MTILYKDDAHGDVSKFTISTWVYVPSDSARTAVTEAEALVTNPNAREGGHGIYRRIPILQFGKSIRPRVGVNIFMGNQMFSFLSVCLWFPFAGDMFLTRNIFGQYMIGTMGKSADGWYGPNQFFSGGMAFVEHSDRWLFMWDVLEDLQPIIFAASSQMLGSASLLYARVDPGYCGPPIPNYNGFNDYGMNKTGITGAGGCDLPIRPWTLRRAHQTTFTFTGVFKALGDNLTLGVKKGDEAKEGKLINSYIYFGSWPLGVTPVNRTLQPTPTTGPDAFNMIRMPESFGGGRYFCFGHIVIMYPEFPGVDGEPLAYTQDQGSSEHFGSEPQGPAIPSTLYVTATPTADNKPGGSGSVTFYMTGKYPPQADNTAKEFEGGTTIRDPEPFLPTLTFTSGGFKLDSWNHIFLTVDLTEMELSGGRKNLLDMWDKGINVRPPVMGRPPKSAFIVNGQKSKAEPIPSFQVYMHNPFVMAGGAFGLPLIPQDVGRCKVTGRNQKIRYHNTMVWFDKYIEPTKENMANFYWKSKNKDFNLVRPPPSQKDASKAFGKPHIWLYRDKDDQGDAPKDAYLQAEGDKDGIKFEKNHGTAGSFTFDGTKPKDYRPGPGQPRREKQSTT